MKLKRKNKILPLTFGLAALTIAPLVTIACGSSDSNLKPTSNELEKFINEQAKNYVTNHTAYDALQILTGPKTKNVTTGTMQDLIPRNFVDSTGSSIQTSFAIKIASHLLIGTKNDGLYQSKLDSNGAMDTPSKYVGTDITENRLPSSLTDAFVIKINETNLVIGTNGNGLYEINLNSDGSVLSTIHYPNQGEGDTQLPAILKNGIKTSDNHLIIMSDSSFYDVVLGENHKVETVAKFSSSFSGNPTNSQYTWLSSNKIWFSYKNSGVPYMGILSINATSGSIENIDGTGTFEDFPTAGTAYSLHIINDAYFFYFPDIDSYVKIAIGAIDSSDAKPSITKKVNIDSVGSIKNLNTLIKLKENLISVGTNNGGLLLVKINSNTGDFSEGDVKSFPIGTDLGTLPSNITNSMNLSDSHVFLNSYDCLINPFDKEVNIIAQTNGNKQTLTFRINGYKDEVLTWNYSI